MTWLMQILRIYLEGSCPFNKEMRDKALNISKNPKHNGYQRGLASMVKWLNEYIF